MNGTSAAEISNILNGLALPTTAMLESPRSSRVTESTPVSPAKRKRVADSDSRQDPLSNGSGKLRRPRRFQENKTTNGRGLSNSNDIFDILNAVGSDDAFSGRKTSRVPQKSDQGAVRGKGRPRKVEGAQPARPHERNKMPTIRKTRNLRSGALPEDATQIPDWSKKPEHALRSKRIVRVHPGHVEKGPTTTHQIRISPMDRGHNTTDDSSSAQVKETRDYQQELLPQDTVSTRPDGGIHHPDSPESAQRIAKRKERIGQDGFDEQQTDSNGDIDSDGLSDDVHHNDLDFFGAYDAWKMVLKSAKKVGKLTKARGKDDVDLPLKTNAGKRFVKSVGKVSDVYREMASTEDRGHDERKKRQRQLSERLDHVEELVENLHEHHAAGRKESSGTIRDIYAYAIPSLVMLLREACKCRNDEYSNPANTSAICEIIRIQNIAIEVCEIARASKVKPTTGRPIIKPTSQVILPYLRDVRKAFLEELQSREEKLKQEKNHANLAKSHTDVRQADSKLKEENERLRKQRCKEMHDRLLQNKRDLFGGSRTPRPSVRDGSEELPVANGKITAPTTESEELDQSHQRWLSNAAELNSAGLWTHEEEVELLKQLLRLQHLRG